MMFRRKLFWVLYRPWPVVLPDVFLRTISVRLSLPTLGPGRQGQLTLPARTQSHWFKKLVKLNGEGESYQMFFSYQGHILMVILALAGSISWATTCVSAACRIIFPSRCRAGHYLTGKALAIAVFVNLLTTIPALVLYVQYGFAGPRDYLSSTGICAIWHPRPMGRC